MKRTAEQLQCQVWRVLDADHEAIAYLVTEKGRVNEPVAYVPSSVDPNDDSSEHDPDRGAFLTARNIAENPGHAARYTDVVDLRDVGRPDSTRETPAWLFNLWVAPLDPDDMDDTGGSCHLDDLAERLNPFCPVRLRQWIQQRGGEIGPDYVTLPLRPRVIELLRADMHCNSEFTTDADLLVWAVDCIEASGIGGLERTIDIYRRRQESMAVAATPRRVARVNKKAVPTTTEAEHAGNGHGNGAQSGDRQTQL